MRVVLLSVCALVMASSTAWAEGAPPGATGAWHVLFSEGIWYDTMGHDQGGGVSGELVIARSIRPHLFVGGRAASFASLHISFGNDDPSDDPPDGVMNIGPLVGTAANAGAFVFFADAAPGLSVIQRESMTDAKYTAGLGVDAGVAARLGSRFMLGLAATGDLNVKRTVMGGALTLGAAWR